MTQTKQKVKIQPLADRVLVQRLESEDTVKGGIILPDSAKKKQEVARVMALGTGKVNAEGKKQSFPVKEGDLILIEKYSGQELSFEDEEYVILRASDIIATVTE